MKDLERLETLNLKNRELGLTPEEEQERSQLRISLVKAKHISEYYAEVKDRALECLKNQDYKGLERLYEDVLKAVAKDQWRLNKATLDFPYYSILEKLEIVSLKAFNSILTDRLDALSTDKDNNYAEYLKEVFSRTPETIEEYKLHSAYDTAYLNTYKAVVKLGAGFTLAESITSLEYTCILAYAGVLTRLKEFRPEEYKDLSEYTLAEVRVANGIIESVYNEVENIMINYHKDYNHDLYSLEEEHNLNKLYHKNYGTEEDFMSMFEKIFGQQ